MTELKTLKDFEHKFDDKLMTKGCLLCGASPYFIDGVLDDKITPCKIAKCPNDKGESYLFPILRQEAIKWIKAIRKDDHNQWTLSKIIEGDISKNMDIAVIATLIHIFNITEEDLK